MDFHDRVLTQLNELQQIESIFTPQTASTDFTYTQLRISDLDDTYAPVCFGSGTLIKTQDGVRPVEMLRIGDMVLTVDNGLQPIRWIGSLRDLSFRGASEGNWRCGISKTIKNLISKVILRHIK